MLLKRPQHRRFEYEPRFYDPDRDDRERFKQRMRLQRARYRQKRRSGLFWVVIFGLVMYIYLYLSGAIR